MTRYCVLSDYTATSFEVAGHKVIALIPYSTSSDAESGDYNADGKEWINIC